jgi:hypothetical protein
MSDDRVKVKLEILPENLLLAKRSLNKGGKAQIFVDSEVLRCCDSYVPFRTGMLKRSGITATVKGSGMVRYNTPYARLNYYSNKGNGREGMNKGGKRGRLWFERMKPDYKDSILNGVKKIVRSK